LRVGKFPFFAITELENPYDFGFNTDVKHGDTIYHVQSEARESERLLQNASLRPRPLHWKKSDLLWREKLATARSPIRRKNNKLREQHDWCWTQSVKANSTMSSITPKPKPWPQ